MSFMPIGGHESRRLFANMYIDNLGGKPLREVNRVSLKINFYFLD